MSKRRNEDETVSEVEALRAVVREAHEAIRDLNRLMREVKQAREEAEAMASGMVEQAIQAAVQVGLQGYEAAIMTAIDNAEETIYKRFDKIGAILMGEEPGQPDLEEVIRSALYEGRIKVIKIPQEQR